VTKVGTPVVGTAICAPTVNNMQERWHVGKGVCVGWGEEEGGAGTNRACQGKVTPGRSGSLRMCNDLPWPRSP
jgi:hypothetical protein